MSVIVNENDIIVIKEMRKYQNTEGKDLLEALSGRLSVKSFTHWLIAKGEISEVQQVKMNRIYNLKDVFMYLGWVVFDDNVKPIPSMKGFQILASYINSTRVYKKWFSEIINGEEYQLGM